jgi:hypothetical protein
MFEASLQTKPFLEEEINERFFFMSTTISNDNVSNTYDRDYGPHDTLPLPTEVERAFHQHAGGDVTAWFEQHGIDAEPIGKIIQYAMIWNPETGRYRFQIYGADHIGEPVLAVPIYEDGKFIDLLLVSDDMSFETATCRAKWLGSVTGPVVRLHAHPMDWLEAGCTGVCHIEPISRKALKDLRNVETIECSDIHTAVQAWDWGFGGEDDELARFVVDDSPGNIRSYFEDEAKWRSSNMAVSA